MYINFEIRINEIKNPHEPQVVYRGDGYVVRSFPLAHTRTCVGYSFIEDDRPGIFYPEKAVAANVARGPLWSTLQSGKPVRSTTGKMVMPKEVMGPQRRGRKFSFVTDSLPIPSIADEVRNSDLFMCEGMFMRDLSEEAQEKKHMTSTDAGRLARSAGGIRRMGLLHYSPRYGNRDVAQLGREARDYFPNAFAARDRQAITIPYQDEEEE